MKKLICPCPIERGLDRSRVTLQTEGGDVGNEHNTAKAKGRFLDSFLPQELPNMASNPSTKQANQIK